MSTTSPFAQTVPTDSPGTGLAIPVIDAEIVFKPGGATPFIQLVREHVAAQNLDISTDDGKEFVRKFAFKIVKTKTEGVRRADARMEDAKKLIADVNSEKKFFVAEMEKIHHEVRYPLTLYENRDKERQGAHEQALGEIYDACMFIGTPTIEAIKTKLAKVLVYSGRNWEEFQDRATSALEQARPALEAMLAKAEKAEADRLELEANRKELKRLQDEANQRKRLDDLAEAARQATALEQERQAQRAAMPAKTLWVPPGTMRPEEVPAKAFNTPKPETPIMDQGLPRIDEGVALDAPLVCEKSTDEEIDVEIYEALIDVVDLDADVAADVVRAIRAGQIPHVKIV